MLEFFYVLLEIRFLFNFSLLLKGVLLTKINYQSPPGSPVTMMSFAILTADQSESVFPGVIPLLTASLFCEIKKILSPY